MSLYALGFHVGRPRRTGVAELYAQGLRLGLPDPEPPAIELGPVTPPDEPIPDWLAEGGPGPCDLPTDSRGGT